MIKITIEEPEDPKHYPKTNVYQTVYGEQNCWAFYCPDVNEIRIVKQRNLLRTAYLLLHELGHWVIDLIMGDKRGDKIHRIYDAIDNKIVRWEVIIRKER